jgi:uncharacterized phage protein (TIGR01671 family)
MSDNVNRVIEFRGKTTDCYNRWVYGNYITMKTQSGMSHSIASPNHHIDNHFVDPKTVGQYIGKKDADGRRIYEGDLSLIESVDLVVTVIYSDQYNGFMLESDSGSVASIPDNCVIIGNIFEK